MDTFHEHLAEWRKKIMKPHVRKLATPEQQLGAQ
jgi:hypothetical protein